MKYFLFLIFLSILSGSVSRSSVKILDSDNFQEIVLNKSKYVFVYFYSSSCGDCEDYSDVMDQISELYQSRHNLVIAKADVDRQIPEEKAEIFSKVAPNFKLYKSGDNEVVHFKRKTKSVATFSKFLEEHCRVSVGQSNSVRNEKDKFRKIEL